MKVKMHSCGDVLSPHTCVIANIAVCHSSHSQIPSYTHGTNHTRFPVLRLACDGIEKEEGDRSEDDEATEDEEGSRSEGQLPLQKTSQQCFALSRA